MQKNNPLTKKTNEITIEVVYALPQEQKLLQLQVALNTNIKQAILQSGILEKHPEINLNKNKVGIFSQLSELDTILNDGDRIEIYRSLLIDPKQARKNRAKK